MTGFQIQLFPQAPSRLGKTGIFRRKVRFLENEIACESAQLRRHRPRRFIPTIWILIRRAVNRNLARRATLT